VGGFGSWVQGSPEFDVGERVLVFLTEQADGSLRVAHLYLGKYAVVTDIDTGEELAVRDPSPAGVLVLPGASGPVLAPTADAEVVQDMTAKIRRHALRGKPGKRVRGAQRSALASTISQANAAFRLFANAARWWEPDWGQTVAYRINDAGEPLAPTRGFGQVRDALAAWSTVPGSALRLVDGGTTTARGIVNDGVNAISFRDPFNQIGTMGRRCSGVLAIGAHFYSTLSSRTVNGRQFYRITEGDLVTNKGWEGCGFYEIYANFAEVITHELGHTVGFDHATDRNATMHGFLHFDGRGAGLTATDTAGVVFVYPGTGPGPSRFTLSVTRTGTGLGTVQSTPAGVSCGSDCSEAFSSGTVVDLTATAQAGSTFAGWSGACAGTGACRVTLTANATVSARFTASGGPTGGPDLVVSSVSSPPATAGPGTRFKTLDTVRNAGGAPAPASHTGYFLVPAGSAAGPWVPLRSISDTRRTRPLPAGQEISTTRSFEVPRTTAPGTYTVVACADVSKRVAETDESNNCRDAAGSLVVGHADLSVTGLTGVPNRAHRGHAFGVTDTVRNVGAGGAGATSVRYYVSPTPAVGAGALSLRNQRRVPGLGSGETSTGSVEVSVPPGLPPGPYHVIACVVTNQDGDPANNCFTAGARLTVDP
jgi:hypothetical protein